MQEIIEADWYHLLQEQRFLLSPNYLREGGKAVIAIWGAQLSPLAAEGSSLSRILFSQGFGFKDSKHTPDQMRALTTFFRNSTPGGAYLLGGAPAHWRTSDSDADSNPEFVTAWMQSFDAISPWTVGRYSDQKSADAFAEDRIQGDVMFLAKWTMTRGKRVDYMPVVHPGGSVRHLPWVDSKADKCTRHSICLTDTLHSTVYHAKVGDSYGDRYTMLAGGGLV